MAFSISFGQMSLSAGIILSFTGTYLALRPPNPNRETSPSTQDSLRRFNLANKHTTSMALAPFGLLAIHASSLAYFGPSFSLFPQRHAVANGLNPDLISWSPATALPIAAILLCAAPLRLACYARLGSNFTFGLARPDRLTTTGVYRHLQHPSYTAIALLVLANIALLARPDGVLTYWIPPAWYGTVARLWWFCAPAGYAALLFGLWTRVREEERMLKASFGEEWVRWHDSTARFVPGPF